MMGVLRAPNMTFRRGRIAVVHLTNDKCLMPGASIHRIAEIQANEARHHAGKSLVQ